MTFIGPLVIHSNFSVKVYGALDHVHIFSDFCADLSAYLDYNLLNLHVAMCNNDNVLTDEVKLLHK
jgi:hypothetical protein